MAKFTTKNVDGQWCVMNGPLIVEKCDGRSEARDRAKILSAEAPIVAKVEGSDELADAIAKADVPAEIADMPESELSNLATKEHAAQVAAKKAGQPIPAAPHLEEFHRRHAGGQLKYQRNGKGKGNGSSSGGRAVRLDDKALVEELTRLVRDEQIRTTGAAVKRLREIGKGSNQKRVAAAWTVMLNNGVKLPDAPKPTGAAKKAAPVKKATGKATAKKAAAKQVTPRPKGAAAKVANQQRAARGSKKASDKTASDIGREAAARKRTTQRREAAKKAS